MEVFEKSADKYDSISRFISFGLIKKWQEEFVDLIAPEGRVLDIACGTGGLEEVLYGNVSFLVGLDYSLSVLRVAKRKFPDLPFVCGDALKLPFKENSFDTVLISFSLRHFDSIDIALREVHRVLAERGKAGIMELAFPEKGAQKIIVEKFFKLFVVPFAKLRSKREVVRHLYESIVKFPHGIAFRQLAKECGFSSVREFTLGKGIVRVYELLK